MWCIDIAQEGAQEPIFFYESEQVHLGGPFEANWPKGESLEAKNIGRGSPGDTQIFLTNFIGVRILEYLFREA